VHDLDDAALTRTVLEEMDTILGLKANPAFSKVYRWLKGMPSSPWATWTAWPSSTHGQSAPGLHLIGCSYKGIGIGDCVHESQIAAEKILKS